MRRTCGIAAQALKTTITRSRELTSEAQIVASIDYECRMSGADYLAYPPVVAVGSTRLARR